MEPSGTDSLTLREMFKRHENPYDGAELSTSRRVVSAMLGLSALLTLTFLPIDPPTAAIGAWGWLAAAGLGLLSAVGVLWIRDRSRPAGFSLLLGFGYAGIVGVTLLEWLAGGGGSAYGALFLAWLGAGVVQPPRRAFPYLLAIICAVAAPAFYSSGGDERVVADALLLLAVGAILVIYLHHVRSQRVRAKKAAERAEALARVDELTKLGNRRAFDEALTTDIARAQREEARLSVGMIDLDGLKKINDGWGHLEGDRCLAELGGALADSVRVSDRCFRWAGDEFSVLLPGTDRDTALLVLERVAQRVRETCVHPNGGPLEISFGAGQLVPAKTAEELIALADEGLMAQKSSKRD